MELNLCSKDLVLNPSTRPSMPPSCVSATNGFTPVGRNLPRISQFLCHLGEALILCNPRNLPNLVGLGEDGIRSKSSFVSLQSSALVT